MSRDRNVMRRAKKVRRVRETRMYSPSRARLRRRRARGRRRKRGAEGRGDVQREEGRRSIEAEAVRMIRRQKGALEAGRGEEGGVFVYQEEVRIESNEAVRSCWRCGLRWLFSER